MKEANTKRDVRQTCFGRVGARSAIVRVLVAGQIRVGQMDDLLRVGVPVLVGDDGPVGDDVVHMVAPIVPGNPRKFTWSGAGRNAKILLRHSPV